MKNNLSYKIHEIEYLYQANGLKKGDRITFAFGDGIERKFIEFRGEGINKTIITGLINRGKRI